MLDGSVVEGILTKHFLGKGMEHVVGVLHEQRRVLKDYDPRDIDLETFEVFYKPTNSLFDYLTDLLLANHLFGDDIRLEGFYEVRGCLHVVISQPFIEGRHPDWLELVRKMEDQGLNHAEPGTTKAHFMVDGGAAGIIRVTDVHEDNVLISSKTMWAHAIDVHFSFPGREARLQALQALGLW